MANKRLARMITSEKPTLIDISVAVAFRKNKYGIERLVVLTDEETSKILSDKENTEEIEVINSKWALAGWEMQNKIYERVNEMNPLTNKKEPNWNIYRELRISNLLKDWDLELESGRVPVTQQYIANAPPEIVLALYNKYERTVGGDPDEEKKP